MTNDRSEEFIADGREEALLRLKTEIVPQAVSRHVEVLRDPRAGGQTLNRAVEIAIKYGLSELAAVRDKTPDEMTAAELADAIAGLQRAAKSGVPLRETNAGYGERGVFG